MRQADALLAAELALHGSRLRAAANEPRNVTPNATNAAHANVRFGRPGTAIKIAKAADPPAMAESRTTSDNADPPFPFECHFLSVECSGLGAGPTWAANVVNVNGLVAAVEVSDGISKP